ncbi:UNVERIFIED_CONTAM: hypothetical protein RKD50_001371 [Streptomyces canus]
MPSPGRQFRTKEIVERGSGRAQGGQAGGDGPARVRILRPGRPQDRRGELPFPGDPPDRTRGTRPSGAARRTEGSASPVRRTNTSAPARTPARGPNAEPALEVVLPSRALRPDADEEFDDARPVPDLPARREREQKRNAGQCRVVHDPSRSSVRLAPASSRPPTTSGPVPPSAVPSEPSAVPTPSGGTTGNAPGPPPVPWWCKAPYIPSRAVSRSAGSAEARPRSSPGTSSALPYACRSEAQSTSSIPVNTVVLPRRSTN